MDAVVNRIMLHERNFYCSGLIVPTSEPITRAQRSGPAESNPDIDKNVHGPAYKGTLFFFWFYSFSFVTVIPSAAVAGSQTFEIRVFSNLSCFHLLE